jgi:hypothetical protein
MEGLIEFKGRLPVPDRTPTPLSTSVEYLDLSMNGLIGSFVADMTPCGPLFLTGDIPGHNLSCP